MSWHGYIYLNLKPNFYKNLLSSFCASLLEIGIYPRLVNNEMQTYDENINPCNITTLVTDISQYHYILEIEMENAITIDNILNNLINTLPFSAEEMTQLIKTYIIFEGDIFEERLSNVTKFKKSSNIYWQKDKTIKRSKNYNVKEYTNNKLISSKWYTNNNEDGTYSGLSEDNIYTYDENNKNILLYMTTNIYNYYDELIYTEKWEYYNEKNKILKKKG